MSFHIYDYGIYESKICFLKIHAATIFKGFSVSFISFLLLLDGRGKPSGLTRPHDPLYTLFYNMFFVYILFFVFVFFSSFGHGLAVNYRIFPRADEEICACLRCS